MLKKERKKLLDYCNKYKRYVLIQLNIYFNQTKCL